MTETGTLTALPDDELLLQLKGLLQRSRRIESDLVAHVGEVDRRRLYAREASPSMFAYCTRVLHLSGAEAYLRISVARAARQHPVLLAMLADGRLHLSGIAKLAPHLTRENRDAILRRATHRSKREIEELVAEIAPRPDVPALVRKLPDRRGVVGPGRSDTTPGRAGTTPGWAGTTRSATLTLADPPNGERPASALPGAGDDEGGVRGPGAEAARGTAGDGELRPDGVDASATLESADAHRSRPLGLGRPAPQSVVEPLAPSRYRVAFTASGELRDKLERLQALLRRELPDADLGAVIDRAVSETLQRLEARRYATTRTPRAAAEASARHSRHIPAVIRRTVYERDGGCCRYVDATGRRCPERHRLEYHHLHPFGLGGPHGLENVRLLCRTHNLLEAEHDYGRQTIDRHRRRMRDAGVASGVQDAGAGPGTG